MTSSPDVFLRQFVQTIMSFIQPRNRSDKASLPTATGRNFIQLLICRENTIPSGKTPTSGLPKSSLFDVLLFSTSRAGGNRRRYPTSFLLYMFALLVEARASSLPRFSKRREEVLIWHGYRVENTCALRDTRPTCDSCTSST